MKNFFDCKEEKITDKAFSQSLIISVLSILLCIVVLCSITYAWFTSETSSSTNTLMSGSFDVTISVMKVNDGASTVSDVTVTPDPNKAGIYHCELDTPGKYTVSFKLTDQSTVKGHCVVMIDSEIKHTGAIIGAGTQNPENSTINDPFTFTIEISRATTVTFEPRWGVVVDPDIEYEGTYLIP